jgi:concentrative nucleoside transporter, CNT family
MRALCPRTGLRSALLLLALLAGLGACVVARAQEPSPTAAAAPAGASGGAEAAATPLAAEQPTPRAGLKEHLAKLREQAPPTTLQDRLISFAGLLVMLAIAWLLSVNRRAIDLRVVVGGTLLQLVFGVLVLWTPQGRWLFEKLNDIVLKLLSFVDDGSRFIFGDKYTDHYFAFAVLPTIIFVASLMTLLYHLGVMQRVVDFFAVVMQKTMGTSGSETLSCAANIFVGQTEAPLFVKPFVATMTLSELMAVMTGGFATISGGVMAAYVGMLHTTFPDIAGHLLAASVMSAPAALVMAKIMFPETEQSMTRGRLKIQIEKIDVNVIDAAARGAGEGLQLALNVAAMLLAFIALVSMLNALLGLVGQYIGYPQLSFQLVLGWLFWPIAWIMGVPAHDCTAVAQLLGERTALNEFVAYLDLAKLLDGGADLSYRGITILTYGLCGFANFSSIAIQIGGIGGIAPSRRHDLARLGLRAMIAGTIACFMTATVAGLLI